MSWINLRSEFIRSATVLMSGTVAAQAVGYLITPLLTRIYTPEEIGELGIFLRIIGFLTAIVTARFELSILLPRYEGHAFLLYRLAVRIMIISSCVMITFLAFYLLFTGPDTNGMVVFSILVLCTTVVMAFMNLGTNWSIRNQNFRQVSIQRFVNSFTSNIFKLIFGYLSFGSTGLLLAVLIGAILSTFTYIKDYFNLYTKKFKNYSIKKMRVLGIEYKEFPLVNLPHVLTDLGRDMLIGLLIVSFFSKEIFGYFSHSYGMLRLPLIVIGAAVGQVFFQKCSKLNNNKEPILPFVKNTLMLLTGISVIPFAIIFFYGEPIFLFVFGDQWSVSGQYGEVMSIWLMINFIVSPLSSLPLVINKQKQFFVLSLFGSGLQLFGFGIIPLLLGTEPDVMVDILYLVSYTQIAYLVVVAIIMLQYSKKIKY